MQHDANGALQWRDESTQPALVLTREPDAGWWLRTTTRVMSWLPIESQL
ncbi:MAG: hypothetical protein ACTS5I_06900 [Rhodanobacter sp.]